MPRKRKNAPVDVPGVPKGTRLTGAQRKRAGLVPPKKKVETRDPWRDIAEQRAIAKAELGLPPLEKIITAAVLRDYVREYVAPQVVGRLYRVAMGAERFVVSSLIGPQIVEAPPSVQVSAMAKLLDVAVPSQLGLTDGDGNTLPGVIALPPLDMDAARAEGPMARFASLSNKPVEVVEVGASDTLSGADGIGTRDARATEGDGSSPSPTDDDLDDDLEVVEVDEVQAIQGAREEDRAPVPGTFNPGPQPLEAVMLKRFRARANGRNGGNGNGNGAKHG